MPVRLDELESLADEVARLAAARSERIVLAESCTAGLVARLLSRVPGASEWFCGSLVVYRNASKTAWLGVSAEMLADPAIGPVSAETAAAMTAGALRVTPEATLAASVTGHLGPNAPIGLDGVIYVGVERGGASGGSAGRDVRRFALDAVLREDSACGTLRLQRQQEAAGAVLNRLSEALASA